MALKRRINRAIGKEKVNPAQFSKGPANKAMLGSRAPWMVRDFETAQRIFVVCITVVAIGLIAGGALLRSPEVPAKAGKEQRQQH